MESFEDIRKKHIENLTAEMGDVGRKLVELGWSRERVLAYITQLLDNPTDTAPGDPNASRKED